MLSFENKKLLPIAAGALLVVVLVISLLFFVLYSRRHRSYTLFFPRYGTKREVQWEIRRIPAKPDDEETLRNLADEILLGPADLRLLPIFPRQVDIRTFIFRKGTLYIDFSPDILFFLEESELSLAERLSLLEKSLRFNFEEVETVVFSVNGEPLEPFSTEIGDNGRT